MSTLPEQQREKLARLDLEPAAFDLLLEILTIGRDLGSGSTFLQECAEVAKAHVDAGGTDLLSVLRPIVDQVRVPVAG